MKTLKIKTEKGWVPLYETYLESCMRRENNLADVEDIEEALVNLGLTGDNVESHAHDSRYLPMFEQLESKINNEFTDINGKVFLKSVTEKNGAVTVTDSSGKNNKFQLVKTVNNVAPSVYTGNVEIDVSGKVKSVNGEMPDVTGNITISSVPVGTIFPYAGSSAPSGYLLCNGAEVRRKNYSKLFEVIGVAFGSGDGSTTFNLPNITDNRFMEFSSEVGYKKDPGLPNITGFVASFPHKCDNMWAEDDNGSQGPNGAFYDSGRARTGRDGGREGSSTAFDASRSNPIYGSSNTVQPKSITLNAIIKY